MCIAQTKPAARHGEGKSGHLFILILMWLSMEFIHILHTASLVTILLEGPEFLDKFGYPTFIGFWLRAINWTHRLELPHPSLPSVAFIGIHLPDYPICGR
jgi:hypothetical protein